MLYQTLTTLSRDFKVEKKSLTVQQFSILIIEVFHLLSTVMLSGRDCIQDEKEIMDGRIKK